MIQIFLSKVSYQKGLYFFPVILFIIAYRNLKHVVPSDIKIIPHYSNTL